MDISEIIFAGDTPGIEWRLPVFRFKGANAQRRVPISRRRSMPTSCGNGTSSFLLRTAPPGENDGAVLGYSPSFPQANPIGARSRMSANCRAASIWAPAQFQPGFPLISLGERDGLLEGPDRYSAVDRLKRHFFIWRSGADLVLDLHCDDEGAAICLYDEAFWPEAADLAAALDMGGVFLSDGTKLGLRGGGRPMHGARERRRAQDRPARPPVGDRGTARHARCLSGNCAKRTPKACFAFLPAAESLRAPASAFRLLPAKAVRSTI
ncbi:peptidase M14 [Sinorhizobium meliloti]|nr:peptidase M14 [Sinorhizobium meliloti]